MFHNRVLLPVFEVLICIFVMLFVTCLSVKRKNPGNTSKMYELYYLGNVVSIQ